MFLPNNWNAIRACDAVLYPQYPVGRFFVDFGNPVAKVAIECDGAAYHTDQAKDAARDAQLERMGWTVYRFPGWMCKTDSDPETGKPGEAYERVKRICDEHGISRFSRTREEDDSDDDWQQLGGTVEEIVRDMLRARRPLVAAHKAMGL